MRTMSWEEAVRGYRNQPDNEAQVLINYFDLPVTTAVERYSCSEEFAEALRLLGTGNKRSLLDVGAGNGIASYALAKHGWQVTALEPDPSAEVGAGAIRQMAQETGYPITVVQEWGEKLPFADASFDAIHARQVLHHAHDLNAMVCELARVLRPDGLLLTTRDHVVDDDTQLADFRANHPLHHLYQGENAYPLSQYTTAFARSGLHLTAAWSPLASILNFYPGTERERRQTLHGIACRRWRGLGRFLASSQRFRNAQIRHTDGRSRVAGRIYSFLLRKPF